MDVSALPDSQLSNKCFKEMMSFVEELQKSGQLLFDSQVLSEPPDARLINVDGVTTMTSAQSESVLGGFFVISASDHAHALEIAKRCPHTQVGPVKLRALNETNENAYP